jgi:DNA-binding winged helix-turn-helix (wHTH) protein
MTASPTRFRFGGFELDVGRRRLTRGERDIPIQPKVHDTLHLLLRHADRVVPKDELIEQVWPGVVVTDGVLTRAISALRRALDDKPADSRYILSVQRVGYFADELFTTFTRLKHWPG